MGEILAVIMSNRDGSIHSTGYKGLVSEVMAMINEMKHTYMEEGDYKMVKCGNVDLYVMVSNGWKIIVIFTNGYLLRNVVMLCKGLVSLSKPSKQQLDSLIVKFNSEDVDTIARLNSKIADITDIMQDNMHKLHKSNEKTEKIEIKAQNMKGKARVFHKKSKKAGWKVWLSYYLCISR